MAGPASKHLNMAWVVKELRLDELDGLRRDAERDARRVRRGADRVASELLARLEGLERLGLDLHDAVRRQRMAACPPPSATAPAPRVVPAASPPEAAPVPQRAAARRSGRASLHSSPLIELFRATGPAG
jgi:hypothetical protein